MLNWTVELATRIADWDRANDPKFNTISTFDITSHDLNSAKDEAFYHAKQHPMMRSDMLWETGWINLTDRCVSTFVYLTDACHYWYRIRLVPHGFRIVQVLPYYDRMGI